MRRRGTGLLAGPGTARVPGRGSGRTAAAGRSRGRRRGLLTVSGRSGRCLLAVAGRHVSRLAGLLLAVAGRGTGRLPVGRGARRRDGAARRGVQRRHDRRRAVHRGRGCGRGGVRRGPGGRREALRGRRSRRRRRAERGRGGGLGGRGEGRRGARLLLRCGGGLLLGDLAAEVLQQRVETAVEALSHRGEAPDVLEVEVAQHHGALGGELGTAERVPGHLLAARDDTEVSGSDLRHLSGAVDRRRERQLLDLRRNPVESDPEGLRVARLRAEELDGLLGGLRLVEEDEVLVVRQPFVGVQTEAADVEGESGAGDLYAYVQVRARGEVTDLGLVAALEFPGHA